MHVRYGCGSVAKFKDIPIGNIFTIYSATFIKVEDESAFDLNLKIITPIDIYCEVMHFPSSYIEVRAYM